MRVSWEEIMGMWVIGPVISSGSGPLLSELLGIQVKKEKKKSESVHGKEIHSAGEWVYGGVPPCSVLVCNDFKSNCLGLEESCFDLRVNFRDHVMMILAELLCHWVQRSDYDVMGI